MEEPKFEPDKFIVINREHLDKVDNCLKKLSSENNLNIGVEKLSGLALFKAIKNFSEQYNLFCNDTDNQYYVCNQDEPYAKEVLKVILEGERSKELKTNIEKVCHLIDKQFSSDGGRQSGTIKCIVCDSEIDYYVDVTDGFICFDCQTKDCLSGGTEDLVKENITNTQQGPPSC